MEEVYTEPPVPFSKKQQQRGISSSPSGATETLPTNIAEQPEQRLKKPTQLLMSEILHQRSIHNLVLYPRLAPEPRPSQKQKLVSQAAIFRGELAGFVSGRVSTNSCK